MADDTGGRNRPGGIGEGIRSGIGVLNAFREALEETVQEAMERGDFRPERVRESVREAATRVQEGMDEARERLDFVSRKEFDDLRSELEELRRRIAALETHAITPPHGDPLNPAAAE